MFGTYRGILYREFKAMKIDHCSTSLNMVLIESCAYRAVVSHANDCMNKHIKNAAERSGLLNLNWDYD